MGKEGGGEMPGPDRTPLHKGGRFPWSIENITKEGIQKLKAEARRRGLLKQNFSQNRPIGLEYPHEPKTLVVELDKIRGMIEKAVGRSLQFEPL